MFSIVCMTVALIRIAGSVEISGAVAHFEEDEDNGARNGVVLEMLNTAATLNRKQRSSPE